MIRHEKTGIRKKLPNTTDSKTKYTDGENKIKPKTLWQPTQSMISTVKYPTEEMSYGKTTTKSTHIGGSLKTFLGRVKTWISILLYYQMQTVRWTGEYKNCTINAGNQEKLLLCYLLIKNREIKFQQTLVFCPFPSLFILSRLFSKIILPI